MEFLSGTPISLMKNYLIADFSDLVRHFTSNIIVSCATEVQQRSSDPILLAFVAQKVCHFDQHVQTREFYLHFRIINKFNDLATQTF